MSRDKIFEKKFSHENQDDKWSVCDGICHGEFVLEDLWPAFGPQEPCYTCSELSRGLKKKQKCRNRIYNEHTPNVLDILIFVPSNKILLINFIYFVQWCKIIKFYLGLNGIDDSYKIFEFQEL